MFLNFFEISKVPFERVLNWLDIPFTDARTELKGQGFIVNKAKNLYFNPTGTDKGSIITFVAHRKDIGIRSAAELIYNQFMAGETIMIPEYELHYCEFLEREGITEDQAKDWECGLVKNHKGPAAGRVAFKIRDEYGAKVGYALCNPNDRGWFYFRNYQHKHIYGLHKVPKDCDSVVILTDPLMAVAFNAENAVALTHYGINDSQLELLKRFTYVEIINNSADNVILKLAKQSFVKELATLG